MDFFSRHKKTLFITSALFFVIFLVHLIGAYLYANGKYIGLPGGVISIGVVGDPIDPLNPFQYGSGQVPDLFFRFLFRGMIQYNSEQEIYEGNLARCDLSNLKKVTCILNEDIFWSDGTTIKANDIVQTMDTFKVKAPSKNIRTYIEKLTITEKDNEIIFEHPIGGPEMMEILTYPIVRSDIIDQIKNERLKHENFFTSGPFVFEEINKNNEYGFDRISLKKNPFYKGTVWLDRLSFKFFKTSQDLERSTETLTVILPPNNQIPKISTRFSAVPYSTYEFFGIFFQTDHLDKTLRNMLHYRIGNAFIENSPKVPGFHPSFSIFQHQENIVPNNKNIVSFSKYIDEKNYKKKRDWQNIIENTPLTWSGTIDIPKSKYFTNNKGDSIIFVESDEKDIRLSGKIPSNIESVSINGYRLREYEPGSQFFAYRVSLEKGTLAEGKNTFNLQLTSRQGAILQETLTLYLSPDADAIKDFQKATQESLATTMNTPEKIAERKTLQQEELKKIESLSDTTFYDKKYTPLTLQFAYPDKADFKIYADFIEESLKSTGIQVNRQPLSAKDIDDIIKNGNKNYDILLIGIYTSQNIARIGAGFGSGSGSTSDVNFSNIQHTGLTHQFDQLRNATNPDEIKKIQAEITKIMNDMSFFMPIAHPTHQFYIDRNIKGFVMPPVIPSISSLAPILSVVSIKDRYERTTGQTVAGFFQWIHSQF